MSKLLLIALLAGFFLAPATSSPVKEEIDPDDSATTDVEFDMTDGKEEKIYDFSDVFTNSWRSIYAAEKLTVQPKWKLAPGQDSEGNYETRDYEESWWVSSYTHCLNQSVAVGYGYLKLWLYMNKANYQRYEYPLTYPILTKIEFDTSDYIKKERFGCDVKVSQNFYLPIPLNEYPASTPDDSITTEIVPKRRYHVRQYEEDFTPERCNEEATNLALSLTPGTFVENTWYCAQYEPGKSKQAAIFEVWLEAVMEA